MTPEDRIKLLYGPYVAPPCSFGEMVRCEIRGEVTVWRMSDARIPWPIGKTKRAVSLIVCAGLAEAIRKESNQAVCYWWGLTPQTVSKWRKALGVGPVTQGTRRLKHDYALEPGITAARAKAIAKNSDPVRAAKISAAKRGVPHTVEAMRRGRLGKPHDAEARRKMSEAQHRRWALARAAKESSGSKVYPRRTDPWTDAELLLLGSLPDADLAQQLGRTEMAVADKRQKRRIPTAEDRRQPPPGVRVWTDAELELLGTMPDAELAARLGRTERAVLLMRTRRGIATAKDRRKGSRHSGLE